MKRIALVALACTLGFSVNAKDIATVNGKGIPQDKLDHYVSKIVEQGAQDTPELRQQIKQSMISNLVLAQAAEKAGLQKEASVRHETELATQSILVRALMDKYARDNPISEDAIKKEYDTIKAGQAERKEYRLRHILVKEESQAKDLIKAIKGKKISFEDAAKKDSIDPGSGPNGGELGWSPTSNYVPEFAQAVEAMKKGEISSEPVQTQFGWHVIQIEDERPMAFPSLEEARPQLEEMMRQQGWAKYQQDLMDKAKIVDQGNS